MQNLIILLLISLLSAQEVESYNFVLKYNEGEENKYSADILMNIAIPGIGDMQIGRSQVTLEKYLGTIDGLTIIEEKITKMIATNKIGDNVSPNYDLNAVVGVPYKVFIKNDGEIDHIETRQRHLEETLNALKRDTGQQNYFHPFGENAKNISIGDSWTEKKDSIVFYAGEGDLESLMFVNATYTLKKIKIKKGHRIAYINEISQMNAELNLLQGGIFLEGTMSGEYKYFYRFDLDAGKVLLSKGSGNMDYTFQIEDKSFRSVINISAKIKKVK